MFDEHVQPGVRGEHLLCGPAHGDEIGQVEMQDLQGRAPELALQLVAGLARLLVVAAGQDHMRPVIGQARDVS